MISPEQQRAYEAHQRFHAAFATPARIEPPRAAVETPRVPITVKSSDGRDFLWIATIPDDKNAVIKKIQTIVARAYRVSVLDILSERRTKNVVWPRQIAMYLCRTRTTRSFPQIGNQFGGRDHTTCLHACQKVGRRIAVDPAFASEVEELAKAIG